MQSELIAALRHQRCSLADTSATPERSGHRSLLGQSLNVMLLEPAVRFGATSAQFHMLSRSPIEDLLVNVYRHGAPQRTYIDLHANPGRYTEDELSMHHQDFDDLVIAFSTCSDKTVQSEVHPATAREGQRRRHHREDIAFWNTTLAGLPTAPILEPQRPLSTPTLNTTTVEAGVDPADHARLRQLAEQSGGTLFSLIHTAVLAALAQISSRDDVAIDIDTCSLAPRLAGQGHRPTLDPVVVRTTVDPHDSIRTLAANVLASEMRRARTLRFLSSRSSRSWSRTTMTGNRRGRRCYSDETTPTAPWICSAELDHLSDRLALILTDAGVRPKSFVVVALPRCAEAVTAMQAVARAGGAFVAVDPAHPESRITRTVLDSGATAGGPYHLVGYSLGGVIVHAIAVRLRRKGFRISLLAVMDSPTPAEGDRMGPAPTIGDLLSEFGFSDGAEPLSDITVAEPTDTLRTRGALFAHLTVDHVQTLYSGYGRLVDLTRRHRPATFDGDLVYFSAAENHCGAEHPSAAAWSDHITGAILEYPIPERHEQMTEPAALALIGGVLSEHLNETARG